MGNISTRLNRLEKAHSTHNGQFKFTEKDWTFEERVQYIEDPTPELEEKHKLTDWTIKQGIKLEDYIK